MHKWIWLKASGLFVLGQLIMSTFTVSYENKEWIQKCF